MPAASNAPLSPDPNTASGRHRRHRLAALLLAVGLLSTFSVRAADISTLSLEELLQVEVVSASKFAQRAAEAPSAVRVISAEDIRRFGWTTLGEALASLPGVFTVNDRAYAFLGARGLVIPGDYNTRFLLLLDDEPLNDSIYEQAVIGDEFPLDLDLVERIEYVPGPGSSIYGANAMFGVINVITRSGANLGDGIAARLDSQGRRGAHVHLTRRLGGSAHLTLAASRTYKQGKDLAYPDAIGLPTSDASPSPDGIAHGLDEGGVSRLFARIEQGKFSLSLLASNRRLHPSSALYWTLFDDAGLALKDTAFLLAGRYSTRLAEKVELSTRVSLYRVSYDGQYPYWDDTVGRYLNSDFGVSRRLAGEARLVLDRWTDHKLVLGIDFRHDLQLEQGMSDVGVVVNEPFRVESPDTRWSIYAQDEWHFARDWRFNAGLRYDQSEIHGGHFSPRLGLIWQARADTSVKLLAGRAYRSPNAYESDYGFPSEGDHLGYLRNPDIASELITTYEAVAEWRPTPRSEISASLFMYRLDDLVGLAVLDSGAYQYQNLYDVEAHGVEFALRHGFASGLRVDASLALQEADLKQDGAMPHTPPWVGKLALVGPVLGEDLQAALEVQAVGARDHVWGDTVYRTKTTALVNLTLTAAELLPGLEAQIRVSNLLDDAYFEPASDELPVPRLPGQGRTWAFILRHAF